jgi:glycosyltransferase involved in cell wall biosynthesis
VEDECRVTTNHTMKVGFVLPSGQWLGGRNYLRNLFAALRTLPGSPIAPVILTGKSTVGVATDFPQVEIVQTSLLDRKSFRWFLRKLVAGFTSRDILFQKVLEQNGISVLSHGPHLGRQTTFPTIGWIPDFQHVHLPDLFTAEELRYRDRSYVDLCTDCTKVIVSSESARADLITFAPSYAQKAELLHFVASPAPLHNAEPLSSLQALYSFSNDYFILPNQFWAHKNHRVVISALQVLKRRGERFIVLATGSTDDIRNPQFFPSLMSYAAECDVLDCFRILGQIPFDHLVGLMHHATAFINPSRFEGWSTSVEEAKSMGKQIVLSDIPVHREQAPERAFFFAPDDAEGLASAMLAARRSFDPDLDGKMQAEARANFSERQQAYGEAYLHIVERVQAN